MLGLVLLANTVVIALAVAQVLLWRTVAIPVGLLVAWLVTCRLMVKGERAAARPVAVVPVVDELRADAPTPRPTVPEVEVLAAEEAEVLAAEDEVEVPAPVRAEGAWDMVPTTLPTYVSKAAAVRRTVQTIDLDSTGVWSSGRKDEDSALARGAEASERAARAEAERRAFGS